MRAGLLPFIEAAQPKVCILEMGFGTGLNALLVRQIAREYPAIQFQYDTVEQYPIESTLAQQLNYPDLLGIDAPAYLELHEASWGESVGLATNFCLKKHRGDFMKVISSAGTITELINTIFYDAFAPASQPELWTEEVMSACFRILAPGGTLVTYCAKGQFKRNLRAVGFSVEGLPGPPGKREMTRATKPINGEG